MRKNFVVRFESAIKTTPWLTLNSLKAYKMKFSSVTTGFTSEAPVDLHSFPPI